MARRSTLLGLMSAARSAREFVNEARGDDGMYRLEWPSGPVGAEVSARAVTKLVVRLRMAERLLMGFLDPIEDAVFLTAGLRRLGVAATLHLGRETAPAAPPAGFFAWVECGGRVVSTSLPVREEYVEVYRLQSTGDRAGDRKAAWR
jgi:hypothetical protein